MAIVKKDGVVVSTDATSPFSLQNLTPNTKYVVEVVEELATGTIEFTTTDIVPNAPTISIVAKPGAIDFTIVQGTNDGSALTGYRVYYTDGTTAKTFDAVSLRGTLTGLTDGKQYSVQATMINSKGESVKSATVTATPVTPVASVSVTPITATLDVGKTTTVTASVLPANATNKTIVFTTNSSSIAIANASTGVITGVKAGTAIITATASGKTATTTVTVVDPIVLATSVTVTPATLDLPIGEGYNLTSAVLPATTTNKSLTWTTSTPTVASVDQNGRVIGLLEGTTNITALNTASNKSAVCVVTVVAATPPEG